METFLAGHRRTHCRREILLHSWDGRLSERGAVLLMSHRCCCQMTYMLHTRTDPRLSALRRSLCGGLRFYMFGVLGDASIHSKIGHREMRLKPVQPRLQAPKGGRVAGPHCGPRPHRVVALLPGARADHLPALSAWRAPASACITHANAARHYGASTPKADMPPAQAAADAPSAWHWLQTTA